MFVIILILTVIAICLLLNISSNNHTCSASVINDDNLNENFNSINNKVIVSNIDGSVKINNAVYGEMYNTD